MDIERSWFKLLFTKVNPELVMEIACRKFQPLEQSIYDSYKTISNETFNRNANELFHNYTQNEWDNIYKLLYEKLNNPYGIFENIFDISKEWLYIIDGEIVCRFEHLLRWRDLSFHLGQDLFTMAYIAKLDYENGVQRNVFSWPAIIKTDYHELHEVLDRGMAENHFHLNGSTQIFTLNWISIMNHILCRTEQFKALNCEDIHLYCLCKYATLLRFYFFLRIHDRNSSEELNELFGLNKPGVPDLNINNLNELQNRINASILLFGHKCQLGVIDYAYTDSIASDEDVNNRALSGERKLLYDCYTCVFNGSFSECEKNLFYAYLLLRTRFRSVLIQVNGQRGFKNFDDFQRRKEIFLNGYKKYEYELIRLAVNATLDNQKIISLEARICPKKTGADNRKEIQRIDGYTATKVQTQDIRCGQWPPEHTYPNELFYVFHFPKAAEGVVQSQDFPSVRGRDIRNGVYKKTKAIIDFMLSGSSTRNRVRGIDTCANEIDCRPEVFAESFRRLTDLHNNYEYASPTSEAPRKLHATYHVGEDFLDIVDGLRAIDEVILFCGLGKGSRLGHALALGVNPQQYYSLKNNNLILKRQDLLDNICWLLEKAKKYKLRIASVLRTELEKLFEEHYQKIYSNRVYNKITTRDYYNSWQLRGDRPSVYLLSKEEFENNMLSGNSFLPKDQYQLNNHVSESLRCNDQYRLQNSLYYYDYNVRQLGNELQIFHVPHKYSELVGRVQDKMMEEIALKGIAIEANPSSNYLIGSIDRYDNHPIFRFITRFPHGNSVSLSVSINTDDQGVFDTMLENEYALIALSYEKSKSRKNRTETDLEYIEYLRQQGKQQIFL
jgi:Adenosine deaminase